MSSETPKLYTRKTAITHVCVAILFLIAGQYIGYLRYSNPQIKLLLIPTFLVPAIGAVLLAKPTGFFILRFKKGNIVVEDDFDIGEGVLFFLFAFILSIAAIFICESKYKEYHFSRYSKEGRAIVTDIEFEKGTRYLRFSFVCDDKSFNRRDGSEKYNVGDSLDIIYSSENPNIAKIADP